MERLIIDTDPGVDDAQAIMMACAYPNVKIEAITTVAGNVGLDHTTPNACTILDVLEQDIPVYAGCDSPLVLFSEDAAYVHGSDGLGDVGFPPSSRQVRGCGTFGSRPQELLPSASPIVIVSRYQAASESFPPAFCRFLERPLSHVTRPP